MNYFEFFELPLQYQLVTDALRRKFYDNSKKYHPDFHTLSDDAEQDRMLELSTLNNEAYKTLADPDLRLRYILQLKGQLGDESSAPALPQEFLMDMMDINENLMELEFDFDAERYAQTRQAVETLQQTLDNDITPALQAYTDDTDELLPTLRNYYLKKRYLLRIQENLSKFAPA